MMTFLNCSILSNCFQRIFFEFYDIRNLAIQNVAQVVEGGCRYRFVMLDPVKKTAADPVLIDKTVCGYVFFLQCFIKGRKTDHYYTIPKKLNISMSKL